MTSSSGLINLLEQLTEIKETLMFTSLLKDMIKDTGEEPDEEIHRARSGSVPRAGASVPVKLECVTFSMWMCLPTWKFSEPCTIGILWQFPHVGLIDYSNSSSSSCSRGQGLRLKILSFSSWLGHSGNKPSSRSPPRVVSLNKRCPSVRNLQGFQEPCVRDGVRDQISGQEMLVVLLSLRKLQGFQEVCARNQGQRPVYIFYYLLAIYLYLYRTLQFVMCFDLLSNLLLTTAQ